MKRSIAFALGALFVPLAACSAASAGSGDNGGIAGTGSGDVRRFAVSGFTGVDLAGSDDVEVRIGSNFAVEAHGPSDVLDMLKIERRGDTLSISRKSRIGFSWGGKGAKITVTMPAIESAAVTGSGSMTVERVSGDRFSGDATGSGGLDIAAIDVKQGSFSVTGSGDISAKGKAQQLKLSISGSGNITARDVQAAGADVSVMGSGSAEATVIGAASVSIMGSGDVDLGSRAKCTVQKMGSGNVRCGS